MLQYSTWPLSFLVILLYYTLGSQAQSNAVCLPFYNWTFNSAKQSPCTVASELLAVCNGGPFPVIALPDASHYVGPSLVTANPCQCNTVTYSLMSACAACQGKTYLSWSVWATNCATVSIATYPEPIPSAVRVPGWAYLNVEPADNFDQIAAMENANRTESTAVPTPSSTPATSTSTVPRSSVAPVTTTSAPASVTSTAADSSTASASDSSDAALTAHANLVGGAVVGSILGCGLLVALGHIILSWRSRKLSRAAASRNLDARPAMSETGGVQEHDSSGGFAYIVSMPGDASYYADSVPNRSTVPPNGDSLSDPHFQV